MIESSRRWIPLFGRLILAGAFAASLFWLGLYAVAMWPHLRAARELGEPAMIYDPYIKIAQYYDPATDTLSAPRLVPFSMADGPTGIEFTRFAMPAWPVTTVAFGIVMIGLFYFLGLPFLPRRSPDQAANRKE